MGIHSDIKILKDNRILYETILPFSKSFEISWGASEKIFGTEITFFALKPDKLISETFGLDKEVILIYSNYKEIQARTFQASDQIFNKKELLGRVDPLFYILLSPAINIYKLSHQQSTENTQNRIIVPISTQDLKNSIKDKY
ncbi:MAG: hypothetical protein NDI58_04330, partial [Geothrix sp.]|nr:hypothetical protein [Geothrix sp.]